MPADPAARDPLPLSKRDFQFIQQRLAGETLTYLGHAMTTGLKESEQRHLDYLLALEKRLEAAEAEAPDA